MFHGASFSFVSIQTKVVAISALLPQAFELWHIMVEELGRKVKVQTRCHLF